MLTGEDDSWPCQCQVKYEGGYQDFPLGECCQEYEAPRQLPRSAFICNPFDQRKVLPTEHVTNDEFGRHASGVPAHWYSGGHWPGNYLGCRPEPGRYGSFTMQVKVMMTGGSLCKPWKLGLTNLEGFSWTRKMMVLLLQHLRRVILRNRNTNLMQVQTFNQFWSTFAMQCSLSPRLPLLTMVNIIMILSVILTRVVRKMMNCSVTITMWVRKARARAKSMSQHERCLLRVS